MRAACFLAPAIFFLAAAQSVFSTEAAHKAAIESFEEPFAIDAVRRSAVIQIHAKPFAHSSHSHSHPLRTRPISKTKKQSSFLGLSLQEVNAPVYSTGGRNLVGQVSKGLQDLGIVAQECFSSYIPSAGKTTESKTPAHKNRPTMEPSKAAAITSCSDTLTPHAKASDPFWIESIKHEGISAFNANPSTYRVFRNVKDFGAKGDGTTDDTDAINQAISSGNRCGEGCDSSTITPALVYFPPGTYRISAPIISYYYTQLVGDKKRRPVLKPTPNFQGIAVIDADPYLPGGANWYTNQNNFFREVRNFIIDLTDQPISTGTGIHWQVAQATGLTNLHFEMSTTPGNGQQGIFMENGSGGFMSDLSFEGGKFGAWMGNQQFTVRNARFSQCDTAIYQVWNWGWTYKNITIDNCQVGMVMQTGTNSSTQATASELALDWSIKDTPVGIRTTVPDSGTLVLENIHTSNVPVIVDDGANKILLAGSTGSTTVDAWAQGHIYYGKVGPTQTQGPIPAPKRPASLLDKSSKKGYYFERDRPQYEAYAPSDFVSVKDHGAKGDGKTDDTAALQSVFESFACEKIVYVPQGTYLITDTLKVPIGTRLVGEVWSLFMGTGARFQDISHPRPVVQVGLPGDSGVLEISDMIFTVRGPAAGAIIVEWNVRESPDQQGSVGIWDSHIRVGGFAGSGLEADTCSKNKEFDERCRAAFLSLHVTTRASGYFENVWVWTSDHDLDLSNHEQISIYNGRGILIESADGPVWMYGTASEHNVLYQYNIVNASNVLIAMAQTETAYYQGTSFPSATAIQPPVASFHDPTFSHCPTLPNFHMPDPNCNKGWGLRIVSSTSLRIYGAGLYSFFDHYDQSCLDQPDGETNSTTGKAGWNCQKAMVELDKLDDFDHSGEEDEREGGEDVIIFGLNTVGTEIMIMRGGEGTVRARKNRNGFSSTVAAWFPDRFGHSRR